MQARQINLDVELNQIHMLIEEMMDLRGKFDAIWKECKQVAQSVGIDVASHMMHDYKTNVFYVIINSVIGGLTNCFEALRNLCSTFSFM